MKGSIIANAQEVNQIIRWNYKCMQINLKMWVKKDIIYIYIYINYPNSFEKILENVNSPITMRKVISIINFISTGKH